eukprot:gene12451-15656_t
MMLLAFGSWRAAPPTGPPIDDRVLDGGPPTALPTGDRVLKSSPPAGDWGLEGGPKGKGRGSNRQALAHVWTIWPLGDLYKTAKVVYLTKGLRKIEGKKPGSLLVKQVYKKGVLESLGQGHYRFRKPRPEYGTHEFVEVFGRYSGIPDPSSCAVTLGGGPDGGALCGGPKGKGGGLNWTELAHVWTIWPLGDLYKTATAVHLTNELREIEDKRPYHLLNQLVDKKGVLELLGGGRYRFRKPRPEYGSHEFVEVFGRYSGIPGPIRSTLLLGGGPDCGAGAVQAVTSCDDGALCGDPKWEMGGLNRQSLVHVWTIWPLGDLFKTVKAIHLTKELRGIRDKDPKNLLVKLVHKKGVLESLGQGMYKFRKPRPEYGSHEFVEVFGRYSGIPDPSSSTEALGGGPDCGAGRWP